MIQRICFIVNYNLYESKRYFTKKLAEAMQRKGIETKIIDVNQSPLDAQTLIAFQPDLICSFNTILPGNNNKYFWDSLHVPFLAILVDPVFYSLNLTTSPLTILSCVDRSDCESLRSSHFENTFFWPHAIERELHEDPNTERPYDVVFLGSCYDYENLQTQWQQSLPRPIHKVLNDAIDIILSDRFISLNEALVSAWSTSGQPPEGADFKKLFYYLDNYSRGKDRVELIRSIKDAKVHVFGEMMIQEPCYKQGWGHYLANKSNVIIHPSVSFSESLDILKKSKICLSSAPFFKDGTHERIFTGLACGSLPIVSDSLYIQEAFVNGEELVTYRPSQWSLVNEEIKYYLDHEKVRQDVVKKGQEKVKQSHTWDSRVDQLLEELPAILARI